MSSAEILAGFNRLCEVLYIQNKSCSFLVKFVLQIKMMAYWK